MSKNGDSITSPTKAMKKSMVRFIILLYIRIHNSDIFYEIEALSVRSMQIWGVGYYFPNDANEITLIPSGR